MTVSKGKMSNFCYSYTVYRNTADHLIDDWAYCDIIYKKLQAIHLMLYKRWCKTAKIKKYKRELMY